MQLSTKGALDLSGRPHLTDKECPPLKPIDGSKDLGEAATVAGWGDDRSGHAACYRAAHAREDYLDKLEGGTKAAVAKARKK